MSSETGNAGSLLILADGMLVENPEDFYHMQVSGFADVSTSAGWDSPVRPVGQPLLHGAVWTQAPVGT